MSEQEAMQRFERWWYEEGSVPPNTGEEWERFVYRMTKTAWTNGFYCANICASADEEVQ